MIPLPFLEYNLSHPHPYGHWFLLATVIVFLATTPVLVLVNFTTLGFELVPHLVPEWRNNTAPLDTWWGTRRLPPLLRPRVPRCQPKDLGRGDTFRVGGSLFDYTVLSTWNKSRTISDITVQEQERVEYTGQSFSDCYVNTARYDYSLGEQTHTVTLGVLCPGDNPNYPIQIAMQTTATFSRELAKDFIGQYYGAGLDLMNITETNDYRKTVLAVLDVIATDAVGILLKQNLAVPPLSMRVFFLGLDPDTAMLPDQTTTSGLTYANGTQPDGFPDEGFIYTNTIFNLVFVVMDAVNLDLGNKRSPNLFRNFTRFPEVVFNNGVPEGINQTNWAKGSTQSFYYGQIPEQYQTWAETLRKGPPANISLTNVSGPDKSSMATNYLCPTYELKPTNALVTSVFVGSATMTLSVWGAWMFFTAFLARKIVAPQVICHCKICKQRRYDEALRREEASRRAAEQGQNSIFTKITNFLGLDGRPRNIGYPQDMDPEDHPHNMNTIPHTGPPMLSAAPDSKKVSYMSNSSSSGEKTV